MVLMTTNKAAAEANGKAFSPADIPVVDGKVYHLSITPEQFAPNIIIAGDPDRVPLLAEGCLKKKDRSDVFHRGLRTITGTAENGLPLTIATSGMGTPSLEIVLNEFAILNEIDLVSMQRRKSPIYRTLNIIRLGTSAALQPDTKLGSFVITEYAVGMDNTGLYYGVPQTNANALLLEKACEEKIGRFNSRIHPYAAAASPEIADALYLAAIEESEPAVRGITITNSGFFANQGRDVSRIKPTIPDLDRIMAEVSAGGLRAENMEMESSFLCLFASALGYRAGAINPVICNRHEELFYEGSYDDRILIALKIVVKAFERLIQPA